MESDFDLIALADSHDGTANTAVVTDSAPATAFSSYYLAETTLDAAQLGGLSSDADAGELLHCGSAVTYLPARLPARLPAWPAWPASCVLRPALLRIGVVLALIPDRVS